LLISFLFGVAFDVAKRPNVITFYLDTNTKLTLKPQKGDIIHWISYDPKANPNYSFTQNKAPCGHGSTSSTCIYDPSLTPFNWDIYGCILNGTNGSCSDPGVGPKSVPGQGNTNFLSRLLSVLSYEFAKLCGLKPDLSDKNVLVLGGLERNAPTISPLSTSAATLTGAAALGAIGVVVECYSAKPYILDQNDQTPKPNIQTNKWQFITWYAAVGYTITGLDSICKYPNGTGISSTGNQTCQISSDASTGKVNYTVSTNNSMKDVLPCGDSGPTDFSVEVLK
jgi:hypothetical protein